MRERDQAIDIFLGQDDDAAAVAAVAPVGTTPLNVFLTPEAEAAIAALAGVYIDTDLVYKLHFHQTQLMAGCCRERALARVESKIILNIKKSPVN
jgi:hypothetical protein